MDPKFTKPIEFLNDNTFSSNDVVTESLNFLGDEIDAEHARDPEVAYDRDFGGPHDFLKTSEFECNPIASTNQEILLGEPLKTFSMKFFVGKSTTSPQTDELNDTDLPNYDLTQKPYLDYATIKENFDDSLHVKQPIAETAPAEFDDKMDVDEVEGGLLLSSLNNQPETLESLNESDVEYLLQKKSKPQNTASNSKKLEKSSQKTSKHVECTVVVTRYYLYIPEKREYRKFGKDLVDCCKISSYDESLQQSDILVATFLDGSAVLMGLLQDEHLYWNIEILETVQLSQDKTAEKVPFKYGLRLWNVVSHPHDPRICVFYSLKSSQLKFYNIHCKKFELLGKGNLWCQGYEFHSVNFFPSTYNSTNGENNENGKFDGAGFSKLLERNTDSNMLEGTPTTYVLHVVTTHKGSNYSLFIFYYNEWSKGDWCVSTKQSIQHRRVEFSKSKEAVIPAKSCISVPLLKQEIVTLNCRKTGFCYYNLLELSSANSENVDCFEKNIIVLDDDDERRNKADETVKLSFVSPCSLGVLKYWKDLYTEKLQATESCFIVALSTGHLLMAFVQSNKNILFGLITKVKGVNSIVLSVSEAHKYEKLAVGIQNQHLKIVISSKFGLVHYGEISDLVQFNENENKSDISAFSNCFFSSWQDVASVYCKNYENIFELKEIFTTVPQCEKLLTIPSVAGSTNSSGHGLWSFDNKFGATQFLFQRSALRFSPIFESNKFLTASKFFCFPMSEFHNNVVQTHFAPYFQNFTNHTKETKINEYVLFVFTLAGNKTTFQLWNMEIKEFHCLDDHFGTLEALLKGSTSVCKVVGKRFLVRAIDIDNDDAFTTLPFEVYRFRDDGIVDTVTLEGFESFSAEDLKNMVIEIIDADDCHIGVLLSIAGVQLCFYTRHTDVRNQKAETIYLKTWNFKAVLIENDSLRRINSMQFSNFSLLLGNGTTAWQYKMQDDNSDMRSSKQVDLSFFWDKGLFMFNSHLALNRAEFHLNLPGGTDSGAFGALPVVGFPITNMYTPFEQKTNHMRSNSFQTVSYDFHSIHYLDFESKELFDVDLNMPWNPKHHLIMCCDVIGTNHIAVLFDDKFCILGKNLDSDIKFLSKNDLFNKEGDLYTSLDGPSLSKKENKFDTWNTTTESVRNVNRILLKKMIGNGTSDYDNPHGITINKSIFEYCDKVNRVIFFDFKSYLGESPVLYGMKPHYNVMNKLCKIDDNGIFASLKYPRKDKNLTQSNDTAKRKFTSKSFRVPLILKVYPSTESERFNVLVNFNELGSSKNVLKIIKLVPSSKKICLKQVFEYKFCDNDPFGQDVTWIEIPTTRTMSNNDYYLVWLYNEKENAIKALRFHWTKSNSIVSESGVGDINSKQDSLQLVSNCSWALPKYDMLQLVSNNSWVLPPFVKLKQMCTLPEDRLLLLFENNTLGVLVHKLKLKQDTEDDEESFFKKYMHSLNYRSEKEILKDMEKIGYEDPITERNFNYEYNDIEIHNSKCIPSRLKKHEDENHKLNDQKLAANETSDKEPLFYPLPDENYKIMELYSQELGVFKTYNIDYIIPLPEYSYMKNQNMFLAFDVFALGHFECVINITLMHFKSTEKKIKVEHLDEVIKHEKNNQFFRAKTLATKKCTNPVLSAVIHETSEQKSVYKPILDVKLVPLGSNSLTKSDVSNSYAQNEYYFVHVLLANGQLETLELKEIYPSSKHEAEAKVDENQLL
ncbi:hypothetical protein ACO0QE_000034 [Hanseniaspora vineae]